MSLRILHTSDFHGRLSPPLVNLLGPLRDQADLFFDCGDCIKTGNLGVPLGQEPVWDRLASLRVSASVLGNRETHPLQAAFEAKIRGATGPILVGNMFCSDGSAAFRRSLILEAAGFKVGVFGVMVPMATERMKTKSAWAHRWTAPIPVACEIAEELRPQVDVVIALTHIGHRDDITLAQKSDKIDIILGGHSHTVLEAPERVNRTWICHAGSHGRFAGLYEWDGEALAGGLAQLLPCRE